ncbi:MAG: lysostaphin resistance A-like protein, partial [Planctomycetia bacterium]
DRRLLAVFFGVLLIPFFEELLFRAFFQPLMVQNVRDRLGIVVTSLIFGLLHGTAACVPVFAVSLLLGGLMLRTQSLPAVWAVHALHNGLMFVVIFVFPEAARSLQSQGLVIWP